MNFAEQASHLPEATTAYMWELLTLMAAALDALIAASPIAEKPEPAHTEEQKP